MKSSKTKILIVISIILAIVIVAVIGLSLIKGKSSEEESKETQKIIEPVNQIPIKERPFIQIYPRSDGREVTIIVDEYPGASTVEYELEYQAGTLLQGAFGKIEFSKEEAPVERKILLGSCSAGGKCSYHENVNGGTLTLRYTNGEVTKLKGEWNFQRMSEQQGKFTSRDAKFTFDVGTRGLSSGTYVIVYQTMGLPGPVEGEIVAGPYAVSFPKGVSSNKKAALSMRLNSDSTDVKLLGWTSDGWEEYKAELEGKTITSSVDKATTFIAVSSL